MRKIFLFVAAVFCTTMMYAVPAPTNVHWDGKTLKWELPDLTNDSVYSDVYVTIYTETGGNVELAASGKSGGATSQDFTEHIFSGRTYYATVQSTSNDVYSPLVTSPKYTAEGDIESTLEVPGVALTASGEASWEYIGYMIVKATLQKQNGVNWDDVQNETTTNGWARKVQFGTITTPGTYRLKAEGLQGTDIVRRGYSTELVIDEVYTVSFNAQSLFADPVAVLASKGSKVSAPDILEDYRYKTDGHIFYWSSDEAGDNMWDFDNDQVTANTTLYAQWIEFPAINPVWDVDTCRWTNDGKYATVLYSIAISIQTEEGEEVNGIGTGAQKDNYFGDCYFPGRKYKFKVEIEDKYENRVIATSALRTFPGEVAVLPLENMAVANASTARITWDAPKYGVYKRHGVLYHWNKGTSEWDELAPYDDTSFTWSNTYVQFNEELNDAEYYRIHCQLNQGEYKIYEGEIFFGANPATGIEDIVNGQSSNRKFIKGGQLFIEREGKTFNAQGIEVK